MPARARKYAYYNEHDPFAAAWLRELIKDGLIAPGEVDERSIEDVSPADVTNFLQCHFFAGIGGWSYALRLAGWPDDRPVWTGSPPCQPFSAAGKGKGFADERHLWPSYFWLIRQCCPDTIFGEQVSSKAGLAWFDVVSSDLEATGYSVGAFDLCAPGVGAFHIRQRLYFVADANGASSARFGEHGGKGSAKKRLRNGPTHSSGAGQLADPTNQRLPQRRQAGQPSMGTESGGGVGLQPERPGTPGVAQGDASRTGLEKRPGQPGNAGEEQSAVERAGGGVMVHPSSSSRNRQSRRGSELRPASAGRRFWSNAEWILCRDGKARPVEPGILPLAHGVSNRVGALRGAGNAIVPELAAEFILAYKELER